MELHAEIETSSWIRDITLNVTSSRNSSTGEQNHFYSFGEGNSTNAGKIDENQSNGLEITTYNNRHDDKPNEIDKNYLITDGTAEYRLVSRQKWLARESGNDMKILQLPAKRVIIAHTATEEFFTISKCSLTVKLIQTIHVEANGWADIGYNFLVGGDGSIYEGRGWKVQAAPTKGYNENTICIAFIGTFDKSPPQTRQLNVCLQFLAQGVKDGNLIPDYKLYGHCQLAPFPSPGKKLYNIIQNWPNWSNRCNSTTKTILYINFNKQLDILA